MESAAPISDMITGLTLYCRLVEDIIEGETELTLTEYRMLFFLQLSLHLRNLSLHFLRLLEHSLHVAGAAAITLW